MADPEFLEIADQFQLEMLDTERPHPKQPSFPGCRKKTCPRQSKRFVTPTGMRSRFCRKKLERHHGMTPDYQTIAQRLFEAGESLKFDEPIVLKTLKAILDAGLTSAP